MSKLKKHKFESKAQAIEDDDQLIKWLIKSDRPGSNKLANRLEEGRDDDSISSSISRLDCRKIRQQFVKEGARVLSDFDNLRLVTIIPNLEPIPKGKLAEQFELKKFVSSEARTLQRGLPKGVAFIGGVDFSLNSFENANQVWQPHIHGILADNLDGVTNATRRDWLGRRCSIQLKSLRKQADLVSVLSYSLKSTFDHRSGYKYERKKSQTWSNNTMPRKLRSAEAVELAVYLNEYRFIDRLIQVGFSRVRKGSSFKFRPTKRLSS